MAHGGGTAWVEQHHMKEEERSQFQKDYFQDPIEEKMLKRSTVHLEAKQEALQTCENAQTTYIKEGKRQSAEQLGKEQAKRLNTQRTEDEHQCVNEAKLSDMVYVMKTSRAQSQTTSNKKDFLRITMVNGSSWSTIK